MATKTSVLIIAVIERHKGDAVEFESLSECWQLAEQAKAGEYIPKAA